MKTTCKVCPHNCSLQPGQTGFCRARKNTGTQIEIINYGKITSISLDPIEKKPLNRFFPGSSILSVGSFGCNLACSFCQNHSISMAGEADTDILFMTPEELVTEAERCIPMGNIGLAFTYNEPFIGYEYVRDCAKLSKSIFISQDKKMPPEKEMKNVLVTNGYVSEEVLWEMLPFIDAINIDLKGFTEAFYQRVGGDLDTVKRTIQISAKHCHVEVTTLVIPDENDTREEIAALATWLSDLNPEIPLHLSRFFPCYQYGGKRATEVGRIYELVDTAREYLRYVYPGNC